MRNETENDGVPNRSREERKNNERKRKYRNPNRVTSHRVLNTRLYDVYTKRMANNI